MRIATIIIIHQYLFDRQLLRERPLTNSFNINIFPSLVSFFCNTHSLIITIFFIFISTAVTHILTNPFFILFLFSICQAYISLCLLSIHVLSTAAITISSFSGFTFRWFQIYLVLSTPLVCCEIWYYLLELLSKN